MIATYKLSSGEYQSPLGFNSIGEMLFFFGNNPEKEFLISCEIEETRKLLRGFRKAKGLTLQSVADGMKANYDRKVISSIESERRNLGLITLFDIAQSMGLEVEITFKGKCDFINQLPYEKDLYDEIELTNFL